MKKLLMVAFHYPPMGASSGLQRTLKFSQYLLGQGWHPIVLTAHRRAYRTARDDQLAEIPAAATVVRAFALDAAVHLAIKHRYPSVLALPDRWSTWWLPAVLSGLRLVRRHRPAALWSTYPIASAHLIAHTLQRLTGLPWIADFRDSMTQEDYPREPWQFHAYRWLERATIARCTRAVFTTPGTQRMYAERYPDLPADRWAVIPNGYDEQNFRRAEGSVPSHARSGGPRTLVHSGVLYPHERDPTSFFDAVASLKRGGTLSADRLQVVLRASTFEERHQSAIDSRGIGDIVRLEPGLPYEEALCEMLSSDALLLFQAANCNHQIPAKVYEYMRARRPILALTDSGGDTAALLRRSGVDTIFPIDDQSAIADGLSGFLDQLDEGSAPIATDTMIANCSRESRTVELANLLAEIVPR